VTAIIIVLRSTCAGGLYGSDRGGIQAHSRWRDHLAALGNGSRRRYGASKPVALGPSRAYARLMSDQPPKLLVYGANGYTGTLIAELARTQGLTPVLAGRNAENIAALAERLGFEHRVFGLDVPSTIDACLEGVAVVLHCAGPFSRTAAPMVDACIRMGVHYLDVTGEFAVFEALRQRSSEAREAKVMLLPGVGFDVVPSDCLAVHTARRITQPTRLRIAILGLGASMSHGTATTMVEGLSNGSWIRKGGSLVKIAPGSLTRKFDFGRGPSITMAVPWGDLATAYHSTGIPDIETYFSIKRSMLWGARTMGRLPWLLGSGPVQRLMKRRVDARPAGPTADQRDKGRSIFVVEVENAAGLRATSRLETGNGYSLTALAALHIAKRVLAGNAPVGFQTPATAYGPDLILEIPGTRREDL